MWCIYFITEVNKLKKKINKIIIVIYLDLANGLKMHCFVLGNMDQSRKELQKKDTKFRNTNKITRFMVQDFCYKLRREKSSNKPSSY